MQWLALNKKWWGKYDRYKLQENYQEMGERNGYATAKTKYGFSVVVQKFRPPININIWIMSM
jgi:hypothetical protein